MLSLLSSNILVLTTIRHLPPYCLLWTSRLPIQHRAAAVALHPDAVAVVAAAVVIRLLLVVRTSRTDRRSKRMLDSSIWSFDRIR